MQSLKICVVSGLGLRRGYEASTGGVEGPWRFFMTLFCGVAQGLGFGVLTLNPKPLNPKS